jgi:hypothetical protein
MVILDNIIEYNRLFKIDYTLLTNNDGPNGVR